LLIDDKHGTRRALGVVKTSFDRRAVYGECRSGLVLAVILGVFRMIAALRGAK
jgi:hypothetical protein